MTARECKEIFLNYIDEAEDLQDLANVEQYFGHPLDKITSIEFFDKIEEILDKAIKKEEK